MKNKRETWAIHSGMEVGLSIACSILKDRMIKNFVAYRDEEAIEARHAYKAVDERRQLAEIEAKRLYPSGEKS